MLNTINNTLLKISNYILILPPRTLYLNYTDCETVYKPKNGYLIYLRVY